MSCFCLLNQNSRLGVRKPGLIFFSPNETWNMRSSREVWGLGHLCQAGCLTLSNSVQGMFTQNSVQEKAGARESKWGNEKDLSRKIVHMQGCSLPATFVPCTDSFIISITHMGPAWGHFWKICGSRPCSVLGDPEGSQPLAPQEGSQWKAVWPDLQQLLSPATTVLQLAATAENEKHHFYIIKSV